MIKQITRIVIFVLIGTIAIWDILAVIFGTNATISVQIWNWSAAYPIFPFVVGIAMGHLFWKAKE